jgi:hypothetical protein
MLLCCLQANNVSCVGVISHSQGGGLAASLSSSDLCGLLPEQFAAALSMPVLQYLQAKASASWGAQQHQLSQVVAQQQQLLLPGTQPQQQRQEQAGSAHAWGLKVSQRCAYQPAWRQEQHDGGLLAVHDLTGLLELAAQ